MIQKCVVITQVKTLLPEPLGEIEQDLQCLCYVGRSITP